MGVRERRVREEVEVMRIQRIFFFYHFTFLTFYFLLEYS